jgi:succinate dehydrogenase/fumarate reductase cytochrome b subunit
MFIWLFHRISGVALIVLIGIKILSGYFLFTKEQKPDWALSLHRQPTLDVLLLVLFTFHSAYGLRTILIDFGWRKEKALLWGFTAGAAVVSIILISLYLRA